MTSTIIFQFFLMIVLTVGLMSVIYWSAIALEIPEWLLIIIVTLASYLFIFGNVALIRAIVKNITISLL